MSVVPLGAMTPISGALFLVFTKYSYRVSNLGGAFAQHDF